MAALKSDHRSCLWWVRHTHTQTYKCSKQRQDYNGQKCLVSQGGPSCNTLLFSSSLFVSVPDIPNTRGFCETTALFTRKSVAAFTALVHNVS